MEPLWILAAFAGGMITRAVGLPALIGFLAAGMLLHAAGAQPGDWISVLSGLGVDLLLFTLGLKMHLRQLAAPVVWAGGSISMVLSIAAAVALILLLALVGVAQFDALDLNEMLLLAFALSFSSTVFVSAMLQEKGELDNEHGRIAIGILILQDIAAVVFLLFSKGAFPSAWSLTLLALPLVRPLLFWLLERTGHDELLLLFGLGLAAALGYLFDLVGLKDDLGALVAGLLVASHPRSSELAKGLVRFKDLFLVGFFLEIGLRMTFEAGPIVAALLLTALVFLKPVLYYVACIPFAVRARTAALAAIALANFSEFGLIVGLVAVQEGWLDPVWLGVLAYALVASFVVSAPISKRAHELWRGPWQRLRHLESAAARRRFPVIDFPDSDIVVFGMGRVGRGAYDYMRNQGFERICGVDVDPRVIQRHLEAGRNAYCADANDADFWDRVHHTGVKTIMLALPNHMETVAVIKLIRETGFQGRIAAVGRYDDEIAHLRVLGIDAAFNIYNEAGAGFAEHVREVLHAEGTG